MSSILYYRINSLLGKIDRIYSVSERVPYYLRNPIISFCGNLSRLLEELRGTCSSFSEKMCIDIEHRLVALSNFLNIIEIACDFAKSANRTFLFFVYKSFYDIYRLVNMSSHKDEGRTRVSTLIFLYPYEEFCERYLQLEDYLEPIRSSLSLTPSVRLDVHIIYIPRATPNQPSGWLPIVHEMAHTLFRGKSRSSLSMLLNELIEMLVKVIDDKFVLRTVVLVNYMEEVICDLIASSCLGPAYILRLFDDYKSITYWSVDHPPTYVRCEIVSKVYQAILQDVNAHILSELWDVCQKKFRDELERIITLSESEKEKRLRTLLYKIVDKLIQVEELRNMLISMIEELEECMRAYVERKEEEWKFNEPLFDILKTAIQKQRDISEVVDTLRPFLESTLYDIRVIVALAPLMVYSVKQQQRMTLEDLILDTIRRSIIKQAWLNVKGVSPT